MLIIMAHLLTIALLVLLLSVTDLQATTSQGTCSLHDIELGVSQGTRGFPSEFHIEVLEGQADLHLHSSRQVLIPAMNFNCTGRVTKWIFPARWGGEDEDAFLRLQIWTRANSITNTYTWTGATTVQVGVQSSSEVYEITASPPLTFMEGDIVGYFQPHSEIAQLNLYLEDSEIITTYRDNVDDEQAWPLSAVFNLHTAEDTGKDYPLIAVETDPPNCGCGFVTLDRINTLLAADRQSFGPKTFFPQEQVIFPGTSFTESGQLLRWIVGGTYVTTSEDFYPELQLWRPTGTSTYQKLNGTIIAPPAKIRSGIYQFPVVQPFPFQPGDVLGLFQPPERSSKLLVDHDGGVHANNAYLRLSSDQRVPFHTSVDISAWETRTALALVSVVIALDVAATTTTVALRPATTSTVASQTQTTPFTLISSSSSSVTMAATPNTATVTPTTGVPTQTTPTLIPPVTYSPLPKSTPIPELPQPVTDSPLPKSTPIPELPQPVTDSPLPKSTPISELPQPVADSPLPKSTHIPELPQPADTSALSPLPSLQTTSIPVVVNSASTTGSAQGLMFYVSLGVVGTMLVMICVLIVLLAIVIKSPRKKAECNETPTVHVNPESSSSTGYEVYTDTTDDASSSVVSQSPSNSQPLFDNPISEPDPIARYEMQYVRNKTSQQIQSSKASTTPSLISAYAISNVHCTTSRALPTIREQSDDYDYADP